MPDNRSPEKDEALSKLLKTWKPEGQLPPRFQQAVWRRIEGAHTTRAPHLFQLVSLWIERIFTRPAFAAAYLTALLFAGLGAGYWHASNRAAQSNSEMRARYIQAVDPYQMPGS